MSCADKIEEKAALIGPLFIQALDAAVPPLQNELCLNVLALLFSERYGHFSEGMFDP